MGKREENETIPKEGARSKIERRKTFVDHAKFKCRRYIFYFVHSSRRSDGLDKCQLFSFSPWLQASSLVWSVCFLMFDCGGSWSLYFELFRTQFYSCALPKFSNREWVWSFFEKRKHKEIFFQHTTHGDIKWKSIQILSLLFPSFSRSKLLVDWRYVNYALPKLLTNNNPMLLNAF